MPVIATRSSLLRAAATQSKLSHPSQSPKPLPRRPLIARSAPVQETISSRLRFTTTQCHLGRIASKARLEQDRPVFSPFLINDDHRPSSPKKAKPFIPMIMDPDVPNPILIESDAKSSIDLVDIPTLIPSDKPNLDRAFPSSSLLNDSFSTLLPSSDHILFCDDITIDDNESVIEDIVDMTSDDSEDIDEDAYDYRRDR